MKEQFLTIISSPHKGGCGLGKVVIAKCICGSENEYRLRFIKSGHTTSCGCKSKIHGMTKHPLFKVWQSMKERCYNKNHVGYKYYGLRGIIICEEWLNNVAKFVDWGVTNGYKQGLQIDRINTDGNYCPENCRFVTSKENMNNRRKKIIA